MTEQRKILYEIKLTVLADPETNGRTTQCEILYSDSDFAGEASTYIDCLKENISNMSVSPIINN